MTHLRVAILQTPAPGVRGETAAWAACLQRIDDAARDEPDLIVLPEAAASPWFFGGRASLPEVREEDVLSALSGRAQQHRVHIAAGLVMGRPYAPQNAAVLFSLQGDEVARTTEVEPGSWFRPGRGPVQANILGIPTTLAAGTDLLDPLCIDAIVEGNTQLIISTGAPRAWVRDGAVVADDTSYAMAARAIESGAWLISAGRAGVEAGIVSYAGGAGMIGADGNWAVRAPADRPGIVLHAMEVQRATPRLSSVPGDFSTPPEPAAGGNAHVAALSLDPSPSAVDLMESVRSAVRAAAVLGVRLVVLPDLTGADPRAITQAETLPLLETLTAEVGIALVVSLAERADGRLFRSTSLVEAGRRIVTHRQTALSRQDMAAGFTAGPTAPPVVSTATAGAVGLLGGLEGATPGASLLLRRQGAQMIAWSTGEPGFNVEAVARTRAREQSMPVVTAAAASPGASIVDAGGALLAAVNGSGRVAHAIVRREPTGLPS